jgi:hypothetical protein
MGYAAHYDTSPKQLIRLDSPSEHFEFSYSLYAGYARFLD